MIDFAILESAWRSSANNPPAAANTYLAQALAATLKRRRDALDRTLAFAGLCLVLWLGRVLFDVVTGRANPLLLLQEWAVVPLLAVPLVLLVLSLRARRRRVRMPDANTPLAELFRTALADNRAARRQLRLIIGGLLATAPLLGAALVQLEASGKMAPHEQMSAAAVMGGALAVSLLVVVVRYAMQLVPERRHLEHLVGQYDE